ncbi:MAG: type II secretion system F family protein [Candidatus Xenobiia bacterium LiM19]
MKKYHIVASNSRGETSTEIIEARSKEDAVNILETTNKTVLSIKYCTPLDNIRIFCSSIFSGLISLKGALTARRKKINDTTVLIFTQQISTMLEAGVSLESGLRAITISEQNERFRHILFDIIKDLEEGKSIYKAYSRHPEAFDCVYVNLLEAGSASGKLTYILKRHAMDLQKLYSYKRRLASTLAYPATIFACALIFLGIIMLYFVPRFTSIYHETDAELPWITSILVSCTNTITNPLWLSVIIGVLLIFFLFTYYYILTPIGRFNYDFLRMKTPVLGTLISENELYRFCTTLACMLECGVTLADALKILKEITPNELFRILIEQIIHGIRQGESFSESISGVQMIPRFTRDMIRVGEETSDLSLMLRKTSEIMESNVNYKVEMALKLIEPFVMGVLAVIAGVILIATFLPLYSVINKFMI